MKSINIIKQKIEEQEFQITVREGTIHRKINSEPIDNLKQILPAKGMPKIYLTKL